MRLPANAILAVLTCSSALSLHAADSANLTADQKEAFLHKARIVASHGVSKGVTHTLRVTLTDGTITHDASVQQIDEYKPVFQSSDGKTEVNFKDSYKFNVAAWKLARVLGLEDMIPPSVERGYRGISAAYTWWIDDVMMDDVERRSKNMESPNPTAWNADVNVMRVFDQLIANMDRNETNILIDKNWRVWMIDHTRAFRRRPDLPNAKSLVQIDRALLAKLKALDAASMQKLEGSYLDREEIKGLLARRDLIVSYFEKQGDSALYDRPPRI